MRKFSKSGLLLLWAFTLVISGCKKKETISVDNESQSVVDNAIAEQEFTAIVPAIQQLAINTKGTGAQGKGTASPCDTLTRLGGDTLFGTPAHTDPLYSVNVTSGVCGQVLPDGRPRTGSMTVRLNNKIRVAGARMIIKMNGYKANGISYTCDSMVVTTLVSNTLYTTFNVKLINGRCYTDLWTVRYSSDKTITNYFRGNPAGTEPFTSVYGTASGVNRGGKSFTVNIPSSNPLVKERTCQYIDSGILELAPEGFATRTVDYGNGTCDEDATFTVNGNTIAFKLK